MFYKNELKQLFDRENTKAAFNQKRITQGKCSLKIQGIHQRKKSETELKTFRYTNN